MMSELEENGVSKTLYVGYAVQNHVYGSSGGMVWLSVRALQ
jgi:hypothetical protein